jgi:hypothetical protein
MESVRYIRKTDLARKTRDIIGAVMRGQTALIESHGKAEVAIIDFEDYLILRAVMRYHSRPHHIDVEAGLTEAQVDIAGDMQARYNLVLAHYLAGAISLGRVAELLDLPPCPSIHPYRYSSSPGTSTAPALSTRTASWTGWPPAAPISSVCRRRGPRRTRSRRRCASRRAIMPCGIRHARARATAARPCSPASRRCASQLGLGVEEFDREGRTLIAEYPSFTLINCYFPNGGNDHSRVPFKLAFYEAFLAKCAALTCSRAARALLRRCQHRPSGDRPGAAPGEPHRHRLSARGARLARPGGGGWGMWTRSAISTPTCATSTPGGIRSPMPASATWAGASITSLPRPRCCPAWWMPSSCPRSRAAITARWGW